MAKSSITHSLGDRMKIETCVIEAEEQRDSLDLKDCSEYRKSLHAVGGQKLLL